MNAALPRNPFATRFTRPEAVAFQCPGSGGVPGHSIHSSEHRQTIGRRLAAEASLSRISLSNENQRSDTADFCHQIIGRLKCVKCGLIVGPHGSGKTTLLHTLMPFLVSAFQSDGLAQVGRLQLTMPLDNTRWSRFRHARESVSAAFDCLRGLRPGGLLVIDGIEQLKSMHLRSLLRKSKSRGVYLLATSHTGVAGLSVLYQTVVDVMLIKSLANRLLEDASPSVVELVSRELQGRDLDACTNVRDLWFELYDIVQDELLVDPMNLKDSRDGSSIVCSDGSQRASDSHR